jgi:hypothetical protein
MDTWGFLAEMGESGRLLKLTIHLQLVPRSRKRRSLYPLPTRLHDVMRRQLSTRKAVVYGARNWKERNLDICRSPYLKPSIATNVLCYLETFLQILLVTDPLENFLSCFPLLWTKEPLPCVAVEWTSLLLGIRDVTCSDLSLETSDTP